jgi:DNA ligase 1
MPPIALDGELWTGRDDFHRAVTITIHREHGMDDWKHVKYMVFDAPMVPGTFAERIAVAQKVLAQKPNKTVQLIKQTQCKSATTLESLMDKVCGGKGEGVMIKDPKSDYERKRSYSLLKVKRFEDAEAKVIGHVKGTGRLWNSLGALQCKEKDGTEFKIGSGFDDK